MFEETSSQISKVNNIKYLASVVHYNSTDKHYYISLLHRISNIGVHHILCSKLKNMEIREDIPQLIEIMLRGIDGVPISYPIYHLLLQNAKKSLSFKISLYMRLKSVLSTTDENLASYCYYLCCDVINLDKEVIKRNVKGLGSRRMHAIAFKRRRRAFNWARCIQHGQTHKHPDSDLISEAGRNQKLQSLKKSNHPRLFRFSRTFSVAKRPKSPNFHGLMLFFAKAAISTFKTTLFNELDSFSKLFNTKKIFKNLHVKYLNSKLNSNIWVLESLVEISNNLRKMPSSLRARALKLYLEYINMHLGNDVSNPFNKNIKIIRFSLEYAKALDSAENVPYIVIAECAEKNNKNTSKIGQRVKKVKALLKQLDCLNDLGDVGDVDGVKESIVMAIESMLTIERNNKNKITLQVDTIPDDLDKLSETAETTVSELSVPDHKDEYRKDRVLLEPNTINDVTDDNSQSNQLYKAKVYSKSESLFGNYSSDITFSESESNKCSNSDQDESKENIGRGVKSVCASNDRDLIEFITSKKGIESKNTLYDKNEDINHGDHSKDLERTSKELSILGLLTSKNPENTFTTEQGVHGLEIILEEGKEEASINDSKFETTLKNCSNEVKEIEEDLYELKEGIKNILTSTQLNQTIKTGLDNAPTEKDENVVHASLHSFKKSEEKEHKLTGVNANDGSATVSSINDLVDAIEPLDALIQGNNRAMADLTPAKNINSNLGNNNRSNTTIGAAETGPQRKKFPFESEDIKTVYSSDLSDAEGLSKASEKSISIIKERIRKYSEFSHLPAWNILSFIVKSGGVIKHEYLAYQVLTQMKEIFILEKLPIYIKNYKIFLISDTSGLVETIPDAVSIHRIKFETKFKSLKEYYDDIFSSNALSLAKRNFLYSLVGYSLASYILQIKDRHNGNILIDSFGHILHVDFGFTFGKHPGIVSVENAPFKLSNEYLELIDIEEFKKLFINGFRALRRHKEKLTRIAEIMSESDYLDKFAFNELLERLRLTDSESDIETFCLFLIDKSLRSMGTVFYDQIQYLSNGYL